MGDENARAFNEGYDDFPEKQNPYLKGERVYREYESGFSVAEYQRKIYMVGHDGVNGWYVYRFPFKQERENGHVGKIVIENLLGKKEAHHVCQLYNKQVKAIETQP